MSWQFGLILICLGLGLFGLGCWIGQREARNGFKHPGHSSFWQDHRR